MGYDVTIGIPVFRSETYIRQALESALAQSYLSIEYLIVDDCGGDNSIDIIQDIRLNHPRGNHIRILSNPEKASNFNALYSIASIISSFNKNIAGEKLFECLILISKSTLNDFNDFISVLLAEKTGFYNWENDDISKTLEILFNYLIANSNDKVNYIIAESVLEEIKFICGHIESSTVVNLVDSIEKIEKKNALIFASVGSIECYHYNINYQRTPDFILFVLKEYFRSQLNQSDFDIINKHIFHIPPVCSSKTILNDTCLFIKSVYPINKTVL